MGFGKAAQVMNSEALMEFVQEQARFKKACSVYTLQRFRFGDEASDEDILAHHRAKVVYKKACKAYAQARARYISSVHAAAAILPYVSNEELWDTTIETNEKAIAAQVRESAIAKSVSTEQFEVIRKAVEERSSAKEQFLAQKEDDPTFGDFTPL